MGSLEMPAGMPDVYGLPEYHISEMSAEVTGHDIRLAFGDKRFGQTQWLYTVVVDPEKLLLFARQCEMLAQEMFNLLQLMDRRRGH
jgi:hypothetical protein